MASAGRRVARKTLVAPESRFLLLWFALFVGAVATVTDLAWRRVPNGLTVPAALLGLGAHAALGGWAGFGAGAAGFFGLGVPLVLAYACVPLTPRGGDVKLLIALGAILGWPQCWALLLLTLLWGGVISVLALATAGRLFATLARLVRIAVAAALPGMRPEDVVPGEAGTPVPYALAVCLAAGTLLCLAGG